MAQRQTVESDWVTVAPDDSDWETVSSPKSHGASGSWEEPDAAAKFGEKHPLVKAHVQGVLEGVGVDTQNPLMTIPNMIGGAYKTLKNVATGAIERPAEGIAGSLVRNAGVPLVKGAASELGGIGSDLISLDPERMVHGASKGLGMAATFLNPELPGKKLIGSGLKNSAVKSMEGIFNATKDANKAKIRQVAPELVERGVTAATQPGMGRKLEANKIMAGQELEQAYAREPIVQIETQKVIDAIEKSKYDRKAIIQGENGPVTVRPEITKAADELKAIVQEFGPQISSDSLVKLRRSWDDAIADVGGFDKVDSAPALTKMRKDAVSSIRGILSEEIPNIQKFNAEYSFWKKSSDVMEATLRRKSGQAPPLGPRLMKGVGAVIGGASGGFTGALAGAAIGEAVGQAMRSTWWKSASAQSKAKLANLVMSGNSRAVNVMLAAMAREGAK